MQSQPAKNLHILSFDLEEWFYLYSYSPRFNAEKRWLNAPLRAEKLVDDLISILAEHQTDATFFCMGRFARAYPALIRRIASGGHEIGAHSDEHEYANKLSMKQFRKDLDKNVKTLQDLIGAPIDTYRTPAYSIDTLQPAYRDVLKEVGISFDSSLKSGARSIEGKVPNRPFVLRQFPQITYFPVSTWSLLTSWPYAGSGFFRITPQAMLQRQLATPGYHMMYFHPRDFDPQMWRLPPEIFNKIKYGLGTTTALTRLKLVVERYPTFSIRSAIQQPSYPALSTLIDA